MTITSCAAAAMVLLVGGPAAAQDQPSAAARARSFTLDLGDAPVPKPSASPTPRPRVAPRVSPSVAAAEMPAAERARPAVDTTLAAQPRPAVMSQPASAVAAAPLYTLDTPIERLIADPRARAVLDRRLPGLSTDKNLDKFRALGLKQFQPLTGGRLTDALLDDVAGELARIGPTTRRGADR